MFSQRCTWQTSEDERTTLSSMCRYALVSTCYHHLPPSQDPTTTPHISKPHTHIKPQSHRALRPSDTSVPYTPTSRLHPSITKTFIDRSKVDAFKTVSGFIWDKKGLRGCMYRRRADGMKLGWKGNWKWLVCEVLDDNSDDDGCR